MEGVEKKTIGSKLGKEKAKGPHYKVGGSRTHGLLGRWRVSLMLGHGGHKYNFIMVFI